MRRRPLLLDDEEGYLFDLLEEAPFDIEDPAALASWLMEEMRKVGPVRWWNRVGDEVGTYFWNRGVRLGFWWR